MTFAVQGARDRYIYVITGNYDGLNEKHERTRRISRYKVRKYIFQWERVVDSRRGTGERCESG